MIRRVSVFLILAALVVIPGVSPARPALPVPTAGAAHIWTCDVPFDCGSTVDAVAGRFRFMGGLSLNGGSYLGTFGVNFMAHKVCSGAPLLVCNLRFASAPVFRARYPTPFIDGIPEGDEGIRTSFLFGPNIAGSCGGTLAPTGQARLRCSFNTETGLSGTREILVVAVEDHWNAVCDSFCEPARTMSEFTGIYTRDYFKSL